MVRLIREDLYKRILEEQGIKENISEELVRESYEERYDLSAGQMGIWFLQQMKPRSSVYNNPSAMKLKGKIYLEALNQAIILLSKEYETLRTGFCLDGNKPIQYIRKSIEFKICEIDCMGYGENQVRNKMNELARKPFDLEKDILFRVYLLKVAEETHYFLINIHHIISDGWSKRILLKKLSEIYGKIIENNMWRVCEQRTHYRDYVKWQTDWIRTNTGKQALQYWKMNLAERPAALNLTPDKVREKIQSGKGKITEFSVRRKKYSKLKELCRNYSLTPFLFLLSVMNIFLYKYTGQKDILIGTSIAGRNNKKFEDIFGYFVNILVLRNRLDEKQSFLSFAKKVKKGSIKAYQYQNTPFNLLVEELNPVRDLSYPPLFQVMLQFEGEVKSKIEMGNLIGRPVSLDTGESQVDLSVTFWEDEEVLKGTFEWDSVLFEENRIINMIENFNNLLSEIIEDPNMQICEYQILPQKQYQKMIYQWNATSYKLSKRNVLEQFERNVIEYGNKIAVIHGKQSISYRELGEKANKLSFVLKKRGVCKGRYVALCLESSIEYIIAIYGVLKAGGILAPIDITYPEKRIQSIIETMPSPLIITAKKNVIKLICCKKQLYIIEDLLVEEAGQKLESTRPQEMDTLCVIFTSGSTGKPKGVELSYLSMKNLVESFIKSYNVTQDDHVMSISGIASASFIGEVLPTLSCGAMLVLPDMEITLHIELLESFMKKQRITILSTVPSMIGRLNQDGRIPECTRLLLSGGERLLPSHVNQIKDVKIANGYGLTESGICNTYKITSAEILRGNKAANVGKPVINNKIYVLDKDRKPVPPFVLGDIYIGGISLAKGYLNQKELTEECFIENPFALGKLVKTGDTGFFLFNGDLIFTGRKDRQVQLRGFRVELDEIEKALEIHTGIKEAASVLLPKEECLAVYYTTEKDMQITEGQIIYWLRQQLPSYMIPKYCIYLEQMPYNQNGKICYKNLPLTNKQEKQHEVVKEQPQTEIEKVIANIWKNSLKLENIGIDENFFDIGGHSLMLSQVFSEIRQQIKMELTIVNLFQYPTIRQLAAFVNQGQECQDEEQVKERGIKQRTSYKKQLFRKD